MLRRYHCAMKRLFVSLQVSALIRGSLPRPWGEGGRSDGGRGGRVRVNPRELLPKMSKLQVPLRVYRKLS